MYQKPCTKPLNNQFGSGPVRKPKGWNISSINSNFLGRSHRSEEGIRLVDKVVQETRDALSVPKDYHVALLVGSATAAMEAALWNLVGGNPLKIFDFDTFSNRWAMDVVKQLKPDCSVQIERTPFGDIPHLEDSNSDEDLLFCWNGSTSGVMIPSLDWLIKERTGLVFCDATSAAYVTPLPFEKLDITAFSYQKGLGAEAGIGCLVLSPKAFERLKNYSPSWPIPRLLRIKDGNQDVFNAKLLNTPSLLVLEEILYCHSLYNPTYAYATVIKNKTMLYKSIEKSTLFSPLILDPQYQSSSTGIFIINDKAFNSADISIKRQRLSYIAKHLSHEKVGYDFLNHAEQPPSFRLWLGPTMESSDIEELFPWIEWAYHQTSI